MDTTVWIVIIVALFFDFTNGFHDTANAIATTVSTKALSPKKAVIGAAVLNFLGAFVSLHVAATLAKGIVVPTAITLETIVAGLAGAIIWNLITWRMGLPSSSSHALIGGIMGAAIAAVGFDVVQWQGVESKVLIPSLVSPFVGLAGAALLMFILVRITHKYAEKSVNRVFRRLQLVSGGFVAFTHGTNDAQKTMGVIALALIVAYPHQNLGIPLWVIVSSATAMALGTYLGGWRIIKTLGEKITELKPQQGFAAETSTAATLWVTSLFGFPVSTTHTVSGSILGAGTSNGVKSVNWKVVRHIVTAWLITIPLAGLMGALAELLSKLPYGTGVLAILLLVVIVAIYLTRNWKWEEIAQFKALLSLLRRTRKSKTV